MPEVAVADNCAPSDIYVGSCTVSGSVEGNDVVLRGTDGQSGPHTPQRADSPSENSDEVTSPTAPAAPSCAFTGPAVDLCWITAAGDPAVQGGPVTLADIAAFRPRSDVDNMEPKGWTIAGLHTNFFANGGAQVVEGTLLGQPASVRFTPVGWRWEYGDGTSASHPMPGASWSAQGIPEFDPTLTSHIYRAYGDYRVDLVVTYTAEYRFAGGAWVRIAGTLSLPADPLSVTVGDAKTVLPSGNAATTRADRGAEQTFGRPTESSQPVQIECSGWR